MYTRCIHSFGRGATPIKQHSQMITCFVFFLFVAAAASSQDTLFSSLERPWSADLALHV